MQLKADFYTALQNNTKTNNLRTFIKKGEITIRTSYNNTNRSENRKVMELAKGFQLISTLDIQLQSHSIMSIFECFVIFWIHSFFMRIPYFLPSLYNLKIFCF